MKSKTWKSEPLPLPDGVSTEGGALLLPMPKKHPKINWVRCVIEAGHYHWEFSNDPFFGESES